MSILSINPASGEQIASYSEFDASELETRIARAEFAYQLFRKTSLGTRARLLIRTAEQLESQVTSLARIMTLEMGKPISEARAEIQKCAKTCRHYAEHGASYLADAATKTEAEQSFVRYLPLGPLLAIMPWNFPFWQVFRFAAPALMAGNVVLLKHASNVPQSALAIEQVFQSSGFDEGIFQTLFVNVESVGSIIDDDRVRGVTLTGSTQAGRAVASRAGRQIKKTVLELGGSDPFIVMPSANIREAARAAVQARVINSGQSCIAAKRFIVHRDVYSEFEELFVRGMESLCVDDPMLDATQVGPLATEKILEEVEQQVRDSVDRGARVLTGGKRIFRKGYFYEPTVLVDIPRNSPAFDDEIFGPVASLFSVDDISDAIALANATRFGLASSVWTAEADESERFMNELEAGLTFVNSIVASDPRLPFGGVKDSGFGRELSSEGIREFVNTKTIYVKPSLRSSN